MKKTNWTPIILLGGIAAAGYFLYTKMPKLPSMPELPKILTPDDVTKTVLGVDDEGQQLPGPSPAAMTVPAYGLYEERVEKEELREKTGEPVGPSLSSFIFPPLGIPEMIKDVGAATDNKRATGYKAPKKPKKEIFAGNYPIKDSPVKKTPKKSPSPRKVLDIIGVNKGLFNPFNRVI